MSLENDRDAAWAAVFDPSTSAQDLATIAVAHPEFHAAIAEHPACYPGLRDWMTPTAAAASSSPIAEPVTEPASDPTATPLSPAMPPPLADPTAAAIPVPPPPDKSLPSLRAPGAGVSGWEVADKVAHGAGQVAHGIGWTLTKLYGIGLIIIGIIGIVAASGAWWIGLLIIAYGVYLVLPGRKFVVW